jgi:hypothetical protein
MSWPWLLFVVVGQGGEEVDEVKVAWQALHALHSLNINQTHTHHHAALGTPQTHGLLGFSFRVGGGRGGGAKEVGEAHSAEGVAALEQLRHTVGLTHTEGEKNRWNTWANQEL